MSTRIDDPMLMDWQDFWSADEVQLMTDEQVVVYLRLLSAQWRDGELPSNPRLLAARASSGERRYTVADLLGEDGSLSEPGGGSIWEGLAGCYEIIGDKLQNSRVAQDRDEWIAKRDAYRASQSAKGKASAAARAKAKRRKASGSGRVQPEVNRGSTAVQPEGNQAPTESNSVSVSVSVSASEEDKSGAPPAASLPPDSVGDKVTVELFGVAFGEDAVHNPGPVTVWRKWYAEAVWPKDHPNEGQPVFAALAEADAALRHDLENIVAAGKDRSAPLFRAILRAMIEKGSCGKYGENGSAAKSATGRRGQIHLGRLHPDDEAKAKELDF